MDKRVILFDLGNTLIFRRRNHFDFDLQLLASLLKKISKLEIKNYLLECSRQYPEIYDVLLRTANVTSLKRERDYTLSFFRKVFNKFEIKLSLSKFWRIRSSEKRYELYPKTIKYLTHLSKNYRLGVLTNGRPSRRNILYTLNLDNYISKKLIFISDEIGMAKPDKKIFIYVYKYIKALPILIDDEIENLTVAKKIGYKTILIDHKKRGFKPLENL